MYSETIKSKCNSSSQYLHAFLISTNAKSFPDTVQTVTVCALLRFILNANVLLFTLFKYITVESLEISVFQVCL